jgi:hypothetical protein
MSTEENKLLGRRCLEEVLKNGNLAVGDELCAAGEEALERKVFGLALALATVPSQLGHLHQLLVQLQEQRAIPEAFFSWAIGQLDERVMSIALEYAHDAEVMVQLLSFKGGTIDSLRRVTEDLYQHEQISGRVYVKAKLLLRANEPPKPV